MKITYIEHSGFAVEYGRNVFVFDYYRGELPEFAETQNLYVFASHAHFDHFNRDIFRWNSKYPNITYILSDDIKETVRFSDLTKISTGKIVYMGPGEEHTVDGIKIKTLRSTDEGVAFFVSAGDKIIYHAGDLNWWHWEEESETYNLFMRRRYQKEVSKIANRKIDIAFVPVDPRLGKEYYWGIDWFMNHTDTACAFPMHMQGAYELWDNLMQEPGTEDYRERVRRIEKAGQTFELGD